MSREWGSVTGAQTHALLISKFWEGLAVPAVTQVRPSQGEFPTRMSERQVGPRRPGFRQALALTGCAA